MIHHLMNISNIEIQNDPSKEELGHENGFKKIRAVCWETSMHGS